MNFSRYYTENKFILFPIQNIKPFNPGIFWLFAYISPRIPFHSWLNECTIYANIHSPMNESHSFSSCTYIRIIRTRTKKKLNGYRRKPVAVQRIQNRLLFKQFENLCQFCLFCFRLANDTL